MTKKPFLRNKKPNNVPRKVVKSHKIVAIIIEIRHPVKTYFYGSCSDWLNEIFQRRHAQFERLW